MSQPSKNLDNLYALSKILHIEDTILSAWSQVDDYELLILYLKNGTFICYYFTDEEPILKELTWLTNPLHTPISICFSPSGFFLLVLSISCHLYILPILTLINPAVKTQQYFDVSDITIHIYPFNLKVPKSKSKPKSLNSSQSGSSTSTVNDWQQSCCSFSETQINENIIKLKKSLETKCEICPSVVCWWHSIHNSQEIAIIGSKSGDILFIDLVSGLKIGESNIRGEIKDLSVCQDKSEDNFFLLVTASNNDQYKLALEHQGFGYFWPRKQNLNGNEDLDAVDGPNTTSANGNYLPSARTRLQGLKQMSAEKLASLKNKIAETRSKIGTTKQGISEEISGELKGPLPENLNSVMGDTLISFQCHRNVNVLVGYYPQTQLLTVHSVNLDVTPLFVYKMPIETDEVMLGDHVIYVKSNNGTVFQVISSKLAESLLEHSNDFCMDSILGKWDFDLFNFRKMKREGEEEPAKDKKTILNKPDLIPDDPVDRDTEKIVNIYKCRGITQECDIAGIYKLDKTKEELPDFPEIESCIIVTNRGIYVADVRAAVVKMALDLILEMQELEKAEKICTIFDINLQKLLELAGDIKLAASEFPTAIALYKLSKCGLLKSIIKLACGNHCSQVLNYSTMLMAKSVSDMSLTERIHLSNLMLMAFTQQILKTSHNRHLMDKFMDFLQKNPYFDEILAVSVTGQSLLFPCLNKLIISKGLILDGYSVLVKLMDRFMNSKVLEWSMNKIEFWKCATESDLTEAMVVKSQAFQVYADYVSQHLDELEPVQLNRLLKVLNPTSPALRSVAGNFKKENSFDSDDTQSVFPFGKLTELFLLALLAKLNKMVSAQDNFDREFILSLPEAANDEDDSVVLLEESFGSSDTSGGEIWPIRKFIQEDVGKFKKRVYATLSCGYGHTSLIRNGSVYTWGHTTKGCLGHGPSLSRNAPPAPVFWLSSFKLEVSVVSCGKFHTAALTSNGLYTWGCSKYGQLGLGDVLESPHPRLVTCLAHENLITVQCGQFHTLALTNQGSVFGWGWGVHGQLGLGYIDNQRRPKYLESLKEHFIVDVAAGQGHSIVLSDKGHVYSFGTGFFGQLGDFKIKSTLPLHVKRINGTVVSIATGYFHNLALTDANALYTWGSSPQCLRLKVQARKKARLSRNQKTAENSSENEMKNEEKDQESTGLLDDPESFSHFMPSLVDTTNVTGKIIQISCGCNHSALVTNSGGVYTWGRSMDGQLGNGSYKEVQIPTQINENSFKAGCISCGCDFTMAEDKYDGKIYCWGNNSSGQLATPVKESAMKSFDGKLVLLKSCKKIVRLLDRGYGYNTVDTPREIPEIPAPAFTYRTLTNHVTSASGNISSFDPDFTERSFHFVVEKFNSFINLSFIFRKSLEYGNFQAASKISLLQNKFKQSVVYQLKALQSVQKYHQKSGSYSEKQEDISNGKGNRLGESDIHIYNVDESRNKEVSALEEKQQKCLNADDKLKVLKSEYVDHAKHILEAYLNLNRTQIHEDFDNCFVLETGMQFWTAEKLPMSSLENFLLENSDDIYYDIGYLLFCTTQKDDGSSFLEQFSSSFLFDITSKILSRVDHNETCVEYLETMARMLTNDDSVGKSGQGRKKRNQKRKKPKSESYLEEIRDCLQQQRTCDNYIKISYGDVVEGNIYFFSCGHHYSSKNLEEDYKVLQEVTDEVVASKLISLYSFLDSKNKGELACPSCVRDYLRQ